MVLGTCMTYVALATGEAATTDVVYKSALNGPLQEHRSLAETTSELFSVITPVFALLLFAHRLLRHKLDAWVRTLCSLRSFFSMGRVQFCWSTRPCREAVSSKCLARSGRQNRSLPSKGAR